MIGQFKQAGRVCIMCRNFANQKLISLHNIPQPINVCYISTSAPLLPDNMLVYLKKARADYEQTLEEIHNNNEQNVHQLRLEPLYDYYHSYLALTDDIEKCRLLCDDEQMRELAEEELLELQEQLKEMVGEIEDEIFAFLDPICDGNVLLEVQAAAGGSESSVFAQELSELYQALADNNGWRWLELYKNVTPGGHLKHLNVRISGDGVYSELQHEGGVHRVQRVPETEQGGRVHTSTVKVMVMLEPEEVSDEVDHNELEITYCLSQGAGGQSVQKNNSKCVIKHIPTGIIVESQEQRTARQNYSISLQKIASRLYMHKKSSQAIGFDADRKSQALGGNRSDKIRTYNFKQDRITDHRIGRDQTGIAKYMAGGQGFDDMTKACSKALRLKRISEL